MKYLSILLWLLVPCLCAAAAAQQSDEPVLGPLSGGGERILSYHSDVNVHPDSRLTVKETIRVRALGDNIKRGIYRDFPVKYEDRYGNTVRVKFEVTEVLRDGRAESHHQESIDDYERLYIGHKDVLLSPGEY